MPSGTNTSGAERAHHAALDLDRRRDRQHVALQARGADDPLAAEEEPLGADHRELAARLLGRELEAAFGVGRRAHLGDPGVLEAHGDAGHARSVRLEHAPGKRLARTGGLEHWARLVGAQGGRGGRLRGAHVIAVEQPRPAPFLGHQEEERDRGDQDQGDEQVAHADIQATAWRRPGSTRR